ncbi:hypothetical protein K1X76_00900 [bacterium]|nr:hypothetical protein [bacterium]
MKKIISALLFVVLVGTSTLGFCDDYKKLGVGLNIGEPMGASVRINFFKFLSLDTIAGYGFAEESFIVEPSAVFHFRDILDFKTNNGTVTPYIGAGAKFGVDLGGANDGDGIFALRFPVGASWTIDDGDIDIYAEAAPGIEFSPDDEFDITGGLGIRYYFF